MPHFSHVFLQLTDRRIYRQKQLWPPLTGSRFSSKPQILISKSMLVCICDGLFPHVPPD